MRLCPQLVRRDLCIGLCRVLHLVVSSCRLGFVKWRTWYGLTNGEWKPDGAFGFIFSDKTGWVVTIIASHLPLDAVGDALHGGRRHTALQHGRRDFDKGFVPQSLVDEGL